MYMNFLIFLERLAKKSEKAADERGSNRVNTNDVGKYLPVSVDAMYICTVSLF